MDFEELAVEEEDGGSGEELDEAGEEDEAELYLVSLLVSVWRRHPEELLFTFAKLASNQQAGRFQSCL